MGTALAFGFSSHHRKGRSPTKLFMQILVRCIKLFVLGLMVNSTGKNGEWSKPDTTQYPSHTLHQMRVISLLYADSVDE